MAGCVDLKDSEQSCVTLRSVSSDSSAPELEVLREIVTCCICLDVMDNPVQLSCSHTFCHHCLRSLSSQCSSQCPQCRARTVPCVNEVEGLPVNVFAAQLCDLIREKDEGYIETVPEDGEEMYAGEVVPESSVKERTSSHKIASYMFKGVLTVASLGAAGFLFHAQEKKKRRKRQEEDKMFPFLNGYRCGACLKVISYSSLRYKCGMCEEFNLCANCVATNLDQVHRSDHILLKLKFKQKRQLPPGSLLKQRLCKGMCEEIDCSSSTHGVCYIHTRDQIVRRENITCAFCATSPIIGDRFKCGMCNDYDLCSECEQHSELIHDPSHVFLVLRNSTRLNVTSQPLVKALIY